jgi:hypothetical protein
MANQFNPAPPTQPTTISIDFLVNMRLGLAQIKDPSDDILAAIAKLDSEIRHFTDGLKH